METIARLKVDKYTCMYACVGLLVERMGMGSSEDPWTPLGRKKKSAGVDFDSSGRDDGEVSLGPGAGGPGMHVCILGVLMAPPPSLR